MTLSQHISDLAASISSSSRNRHRTLPSLAASIASWFPELEGRAVAVAEAEVNASNVPTLPLAMVALSKETAKHNPRGNGDIEITEDILVQFWLKQERYRRSDHSESPFWAFYDYERIRDTLLLNILDWRAPTGGRMQYMSLDQEADELAIVLTFRFNHLFDWCRPEQPDEITGACLSPIITMSAAPKPRLIG